MKASLKRNVIVTLSSILLAVLCAFACINMNKTNALAESYVEPTENVTVATESTGFYVVDGASVKNTGAGIKFTTVVTDAFHDSIDDGATVKYFAVAKNGSKVQKIDFGAVPNLNDDKTEIELNTYLNFDNYQSDNKDNPTKLANAYKTEFEIETYAEITVGETTTYYKAYQADDNARSMRVVANAAQLAGEDASALAQYYTAQDRTTDEMAYVDVNGNGKLVLPKLSGDEEYVGAYYGTKDVTDEINGNEITLANIDVTDMATGTLLDVSAFTSTGKVVSRKMALASTVIKADNVADLLSVTGGYVVIAENIDMSAAYIENDGIWVSSATMKGTVNGLEHSISNLNTTGNENGLFKVFDGVFKNIALVDVTTTASTGALAYNQARTATITISNVAITFKTGNTEYFAGGLYRQLANLNQTTKFENLFIYVPTTSNQGNGYIAGNVTYSGTPEVTFDNCYFVGYGGKLNFGGVDLTTKTGYTTYADSAEMLGDYGAGNITTTDFINEKIKVVLGADYNLIDSSNVADLLTPTSGATYYVVEDIDMATAYTDNGGVWTATADWWGTIEGFGHTISNFKTNTGLFGNYYGKYINDLALTNVNAIGSIGVLGANTNRSSMYVTTINNVYVHIASATSSVGLFNTCNLTNPVNISNSVIVSDVASCGVWIKVASQATNMTNCYLVNVSPYLASHYGALSNLTEQQKEIMFPSTNTVTSYADKEALAEAYIAGEMTNLPAYITDAVKDVCPNIITNKNISNLLTATSGTYYIVEDIDMATAYTDNGGVWASTVSFNGVLDGKEHTITNFKTSTGLFQKVGGTIKNLAILDASCSGEGILAKEACNNLTVANVIFTLAENTCASWWGTSPLFGNYRASNTYEVNVNNSVLWNKTNFGTVCAVMHYNPAPVINLNNTYIVGASTEIYYHSCSSVHSDVSVHLAGEYTKCSNIDELRNNYVNGSLSEFIEGIIGGV